MNVAAILQFICGELARHGAEIVSTADLAALSAIESQILEVPAPEVDAARSVAWVASLTPTANRDAFRSAFGNRAAVLLDALVPSDLLSPTESSIFRGLGRMRLRSHWAHGTESNDVAHRIISRALIAGEAKKSSGPEDLKRLRRIVDIAIRKAQDESIRTALLDIRAGLVPTTDEQDNDAHVSPLLLSVSIDVVGSTEAKRRLRNLAADAEWRAQLYSDFYANFLHAEDRFYADLFAVGIRGQSPPLDWRRLFVIKGIGDEVWLTYDASPPESMGADAALQQAAVRLIWAALALCRRTVSCGGTGEDLGPGFNPEAEEQQSRDWMELPFKVSIDLIEDAIEVSGQRLEYFTDRAGSYLEPPHDRAGLRDPTPFGVSHVELLRRLNAGHVELAGGHQLRQAYRTDYIGPDIDRFFRITKFAIPGLVIVGDNLMRRLRFDVVEQLTPQITRILLSYPSDPNRPGGDIATVEPVLSQLRPIDRDELKGGDADYAVHHLIELPALRGLLTNPTHNPFFKPTAVEFPENMLELIAPRHSPSEQPPQDDAATDGPPSR